MKRFLTASLAVLMLSGAAGAASAQTHRNDNRGHSYQQNRNDHQNYRRWAKGQRLDTRYRSNTYYVSDYRRHGLRQPPRGYRWQKVDNQYVLAAIATGLIASVIIANN